MKHECETLATVLILSSYACYTAMKQWYTVDKAALKPALKVSINQYENVYIQLVWLARERKE